MTKKITKVLPIGTAVFPKLNQVDVYQPLDKKGRPNGAEKRRFIVNVKFADEDHRKVDAWLKQCAKDAGVEDGKLPWKKSKKDGEITLIAASGEKYPPLLVDAKNKQIDRANTIIGGGSKIRVSVTVNAYEGFGGGINLYLNAVQVIDLKESAFGKSPFEESDGYVAPEKKAGDDEEAFSSSDNSDLDDDISF